MTNIMYMKPEVLIAWMFYQTMLQQQLVNMQQQVIEMQQKVIELQQQIDDMRPKAVVDQDVFWHIASEGIMSDEAAKSDDIRLVRKFRDWNMAFAKKHIKPYVNPLVYSETVTQMTRGLSARMAELEAKSQKRAHERDQTGPKKTLKQKDLLL